MDGRKKKDEEEGETRGWADLSHTFFDPTSAGERTIYNLYNLNLYNSFTW